VRSGHDEVEAAFLRPLAQRIGVIGAVGDHALGFSAAYRNTQLVHEPRSIVGGSQTTCVAVTEEEWMSKHPAGVLEYRDAMSPRGKVRPADTWTGRGAVRGKPLRSAGTEELARTLTGGHA